MKKIFFLFSILLCLFLSAACGAADKQTNPASGTDPAAGGSSNGQAQAIAGSASGPGKSERGKKEKVLNLIDRYFLYYNSGSLGDHAQELKDDASYSLMIQALWNYNYGPWMKEMIETTRHSARELEIIFTGAS